MVMGSNYDRKLSGDGCCIFIHAGAGYHSIGNEKLHLQVCADAAKAGMKFLRSGGSAVDAVEMAIKVLEDRELTNSGFGSNLAMDGTVECDATIVDHLGRSGAVGAVGRILNPIHLARIVYDNSLKSLSLHRVPPNLLVGEGATDFAFEHGIPILPHDALISVGAKGRWLKWRQELQKVEMERIERISREIPDASPESPEASPEAESLEEEITTSFTILKTGIWNEGQPDSPRHTASRSPDIHQTKSSTIHRRLLKESASDFPILDMATTYGHDPGVYAKSYRYHEDPTGHNDEDDEPAWRQMHKLTDSRDGSNDLDDDSFIDDDPFSLRTTWQSPRLSPSQSTSSHSVSNSYADSTLSLAPPKQGQPDWLSFIPQSQTDKGDDITDTVGAIAIDCHGNIAAGSSSGGIGMKHKGRCGPAALVGIGTHVTPVDLDDKSKICVATVASGTGEHMATTMAASTSASRLYYNQQKGKNGKIVDADEEQAMRSFIEKDFLGHPSVKNSQSMGAIGILGVKKTPEGVYLYFAHNTDSFAIASMHEDESEPWLAMSRNTRKQARGIIHDTHSDQRGAAGNRKVASGARVLKRYPEKGKSHKKRTFAEANTKTEAELPKAKSLFTRKVRTLDSTVEATSVPPTAPAIIPVSAVPFDVDII